jgi:MFS family permease
MPSVYPFFRKPFMDWRNRLGLYASYFFGMAGIGFTLPYLPLFLSRHGLSDRTIGVISTLAAVAGLAQFGVGVWSDRIGRRKPFLVISLGVLAASTFLLRVAPDNVLVLGLLVLLFAENGVCRAIVESLSGAEAVALARPSEVGAALGALRFWKPVGIVAVALLGGWMSGRFGLDAILGPLAFIQALAFVSALLIHEPSHRSHHSEKPRGEALPSTEKDLKGSAQGAIPVKPSRASIWQGIVSDRALCLFILAMVLFHTANAPAGVYLGLFLTRTLHAPERLLSLAFVVSMVTWMATVFPAGKLADRVGRRPLILAAWGAMTLRMGLLAIARSPSQVVAIQILDGLGNGLFAVLAGAWVTDRLSTNGASRAGEAQAIVGTSLVFGSAIGPALSALLVDPLGYRSTFAILGALGLAATAIIALALPETLRRTPEASVSAAAGLATAALAPSESSTR